MVMPQITSHARYHYSQIWTLVGIIVAMAATFAGTSVGLKLANNTKGSTPALATISPAIPPLTSLQSAIRKPAPEAQIPDVKPSTAPCDTPNAHSDPSRIDVVINKKHCLSPRSFAPSDLITVNGATLTTEAARAYERMSMAAAAAGLPLRVTSSYRSYQNQVSTYNYWVAQNGAAAADTVSARPGYSEHQTGLALDLAADGCALECFARSAQSTWMLAHAAEYGFINRYPAGLESITGYSAEPWHYRYVGIVTAQDMKSRGIRTLEQYWGITGGDY